jgi:hypothetical protein
VANSLLVGGEKTKVQMRYEQRHKFSQVVSINIRRYAPSGIRTNGRGVLSFVPI